MTNYSFTDGVVLMFVVLPVVLAAALTCGVWLAWRRSGAGPDAARRASFAALGATALWMALTWVAASTGVLRDWQRRPPPFLLLVVLIIAIAVAMALGPVGRRFAAALPIWVLVGVQAFRLPLEVAMHGLYERGIMPEQMTYTGRNFDILTGASAIVVAALVWAGRGGRGLVAVWNVAGVALLANVVIVAILSTPPVHLFGPDRLNVFVTYAPFVWLPAMLVLAALVGHLVIFRALVSGRTA